MKKRRSKVTQEEKARIILASLEPNCDIGQLATRHKLAPNTIKRWRSAYKKVRKAEETSEPAAQFIEITAPSLSGQIQELQKVELEFTKYRCQLEGALQVSQIQQIIQILGGE